MIRYILTITAIHKKMKENIDKRRTRWHVWMHNEQFQYFSSYHQLPEHCTHSRSGTSAHWTGTVLQRCNFAGYQKHNLQSLSSWYIVHVPPSRVVDTSVFIWSSQLVRNSHRCRSRCQSYMSSWLCHMFPFQSEDGKVLSVFSSTGYPRHRYGGFRHIWIQGDCRGWTNIC